MTNIIEMKNIHKFYKNGNETLEENYGVEPDATKIRYEIMQNGK